SPPSQPGPPAPPPPGPPAAPARARSSRAGFTRWLAGGALLVVVVVILVLLLGGGGGADYKLEFPEAGQLVRGDTVQVGGVPVGSVKDLELTKNYAAIVAIHVDGALTPLHECTTARA